MESPTAPTHVVVWRSTTVDCGGLCVMTPGLQQTLVWLVVNLDFLLPVLVGPQVMLEGEVFVLCIAMGNIMTARYSLSQSRESCS